MSTVIDWSEILDPRGRWSPLVHLQASPKVVAQHNSGLAYLATPYTREVLVKGKWSLEKSVEFSMLAAREVIMLMRYGVTAVSPIVLAAEGLHAQASNPGTKVNALDRRRWSDWRRPIFNAARFVIVPRISGWDECEAVFSEVEEALARNMPVFIYGGER
ncbi:MAG: DUF1937 family protein [Sphingomonadales bacterium]|nr:DUF1937 family protein [Sphingomonadales bacterium]